MFLKSVTFDVVRLDNSKGVVHGMQMLSKLSCIWIGVVSITKIISLHSPKGIQIILLYLIIWLSFLKRDKEFVSLSIILYMWFHMSKMLLFMRSFQLFFNFSWPSWALIKLNMIVQIIDYVLLCSTCINVKF